RRARTRPHRSVARPHRQRHGAGIRSVPRPRRPRLRHAARGRGGLVRYSLRPMITILVAADAKWVRDQVRAAFMGRGQTVVEVTSGQDVRDMFAEVAPDLVVLDMQIGNMGGVAVAIDLRLEESGGRLDRANILLLLDREADEFIARRADV